MVDGSSKAFIAVGVKYSTGPFLIVGLTVYRDRYTPIPLAYQGPK